MYFVYNIDQIINYVMNQKSQMFLINRTEGNKFQSIELNFMFFFIYIFL